MMTKKAATKAFLAGYFSKVAEEGRVKKAQAVQGVSRPGPFRRGGFTRRPLLGPGYVAGGGVGGIEPKTLGLGWRAAKGTGRGLAAPFIEKGRNNNLQIPGGYKSMIHPNAMYLNNADYTNYTNKVDDIHQVLKGHLQSPLKDGAGNPIPSLAYAARTMEQAPKSYRPQFGNYVTDYAVPYISTNAVQVTPDQHGRFMDIAKNHLDYGRRANRFLKNNP